LGDSEFPNETGPAMPPFEAAEDSANPSLVVLCVNALCGSFHHFSPKKYEANPSM
jgi:hypothetical protein